MPYPDPARHATRISLAACPCGMSHQLCSVRNVPAMSLPDVCTRLPGISAACLAHLPSICPACLPLLIPPAAHWPSTCPCLAALPSFCPADLPMPASSLPASPQQRLPACLHHLCRFCWYVPLACLCWHVRWHALPAACPQALPVPVGMPCRLSLACPAPFPARMSLPDARQACPSSSPKHPTNQISTACLSRMMNTRQFLHHASAACSASSRTLLPCMSLPA